MNLLLCDNVRNQNKRAKLTSTFKKRLYVFCYTYLDRLRGSFRQKPYKRWYTSILTVKNVRYFTVYFFRHKITRNTTKHLRGRKIKEKIFHWSTCIHAETHLFLYDF